VFVYIGVGFFEPSGAGRRDQSSGQELVASMLSLQAAATDDATLSLNLQLPVGRVRAVARIRVRLYRSPEIGMMDLGAYLADVSANLAALAPNVESATSPSTMAQLRPIGPFAVRWRQPKS